MKTKTVKGVTLIVLLALLLASVCTVIIAGAQSSVVWSDVSLQQYYELNNAFVVPNCTATLNGQVMQVTHVVEYPNGITSSANEVSLTQSGKYTLYYYATLGNDVSVKKLNFYVKYGIATLSSSVSSYTYGKHEHCTEQQGLLVRLAQGDELLFNNIIDVNELTGKTTLVQFFATPDIQGALDFSEINIKLEDVENPEKYFVLNIKHTPESESIPFSYAKARANGQKLTGLLVDGTPTTTTWGTQYYHTFAGTYFGTPSQYDAWWNILTVSYDSAGKGIYVNDKLVIDFDNPEHFSTVWEGFESNKVRLSISGDVYHAQTANFCLTEVYGVDLTKNEMIDDDAPVITVNNDYEQMPLALKGKTYPVPTATAKDVFSGKTNVNVQVWFNYASENAVTIPVIDGKFNTANLGLYTIVYKSTDNMGNVATKALNVSCVEQNDIEPLVINVDLAISSGVIGNFINLPTNPTISGGCGNSSFQIIATNGDEIIDVTNGRFLPEKSGSWQISYVATDYIGSTATKTFNLQIAPSSISVFNEQVTLPQIFISGSSYVLPDVYASDYSSGTKQRVLATSVEVTDANGTKSYSVGESVVPVVSNNGDKVTVSYKCGNATPLTFEIPTIIAWQNDGSRNRLQLKNYFYSQNIDVTMTDDNAVITATQGGNVGWTFANTLLADNLSLVVDSVSEKSLFDGFVIRIADSLNPDVVVDVVIKPNGIASNINLDNYRSMMDFGFSTESKTNKLTFAYSNKTVKINNNFMYDVTTTNDGKAFIGFPSGKVYLTVLFNNATANQAQYIVENVSGQVIWATDTDRISPTLLSINDYHCSGEFGQTLEIPSAFIAGDVLDPNVTLTVSVFAPDGTLVKDINGLLLDRVDPNCNYTIKLDMFGQYSVKYNAQDTFNARPNKYEFIYAINVDDNIAPKVVFSCPFQTEIKVGDNIIIPNITVSDNYSSQDKIVVRKYIVNPNGSSKLLTGSCNSLTTSMAGTYQIKIFITDEAGNTTYYTTSVKVIK